MFGIVGEVGGRGDAAVSADPAKKKTRDLITRRLNEGDAG